MSAFVLTLANGRKIGVYSESDKTFIKRVKKSKHFCYKYKAWGIDATALIQLAHRGCLTVRIIDEETGDEYVTDIEHYLRRGTNDDLGHGLQTFLPERFFKRHDNADGRQGEFFKPE